VAFELADLRLFVAVVEHGSLTRGAATQHLSLPSASARVRALEGQAGAALLHRHRRGATPTAAGRLLAAHARDVLARHDRMRAELADLTGATVVLHANGSAASTLLPGLLAAFLAAHPDIDVDLAQRPSDRVVAAVAEGRIDAGVAADTVDLGRLDVHPLRRDRLVVAVPPGHPLTALDAPAFADCLAHPFVGLVEGNPLEELVSGHARPLGTRPRYRARLPDTAAVRDAVLAGVGVAVLPEAAVGPASGLVGVPLVDPWTTRTLVLCTRPGAPPSAPAGELIAFLLARARPPG
jgi:DNA-binding transcriptional LysR family regulator